MMWYSTASIMPLHTGVFRWPSTMRHGRLMKQMFSQFLQGGQVGVRLSGKGRQPAHTHPPVQTGH